LDTKRYFTSRRSLPVLAGAIVLAVVTLLMLNKGNQALDRIAAHEGGRYAEANHRELVTVRLDSRWKLGHTSWGMLAPPPPEPPLETDDEPEPGADRFDGLDIAVTGR